MKKILPLAFALTLAGSAYSAQLSGEEVDTLARNALAGQANNHAEVTQDFVRGTILQESKGNTRATSRAGARGLMQFMPSTWSEVTSNSDFDSAYDAQRNVNAGVRYMNQLATYASRNHPNWNSMNTRQRQEAISAMYNGGMGNLRRNNWNIDRMSQETRNYVPAVQRRARSSP